MVERILADLYRIEIPLPKNPLKAVNSYLLKGQGRFLIIDTGMNREECRREMFAALEELDVDLKRTDFFVTHLHADHLGLAADLATETSTVYFNQKEASMDSSENWWQKICALYYSNGFPESELQKALKMHPGRRYNVKRSLDFHLLKEDDIIDIGDYSFKCIETPGHTPGHICLYEAEKKILVSGDHILFDITPNITFWPQMENALKEYLASLEKVYDLDVNLVLPGHRSIQHNHRRRIRELQEHHRNRLNEVLSTLKDGEKTAYQVAPHITWDVNYGSWELFPAPQKFFAVGETLAHLKYLEEDGVIQNKKKDNKIMFSLSSYHSY